MAFKVTVLGWILFGLNSRLERFPQKTVLVFKNDNLLKLDSLMVCNSSSLHQ